jgi:hypothetical protein
MESLRQYALVWFLFFLASSGLGYAALKRYDPRRTDGLSDTALYYQIVIGNPRNLGRENMRGRLLVPLAAKPVYLVARNYLTSTDPALFGLLLANSFFCALTATILASVGKRILADQPVALLGATLYLLSFAVPNFYVVGMVDSSEACLMVALTWLLLADKWRWLPLLGVVGALAKETFLPLGAVFALGWLFATDFSRSLRWTRLGWVLIFILADSIGLTVLYSILAGTLVWPWHIAHSYAGVNFAIGLVKILITPNFWYFFAWLLPFGIWKLRSLPRPWLVAAAMGTVAALLMSTWRDIGANAARPVFNVVGPMLSLSVAILIGRNVNDGVRMRSRE